MLDRPFNNNSQDNEPDTPDAVSDPTPKEIVKEDLQQDEFPDHAVTSQLQ